MPFCGGGCVAQREESPGELRTHANSCRAPDISHSRCWEGALWSGAGYGIANKNKIWLYLSNTPVILWLCSPRAAGFGVVIVFWWLCFGDWKTSQLQASQTTKWVSCNFPQCNVLCHLISQSSAAKRGKSFCLSCTSFLQLISKLRRDCIALWWEKKKIIRVGRLQNWKKTKQNTKSTPLFCSLMACTVLRCLPVQ